MTFAPALTRGQRLDFYYWMRLTRTFDERMVALWKQGRGVGGTFSQRGHEAISVGAGYALAPEANTAAAELLRRSGFQAARFTRHMRRGGACHPIRRELVYGLASFALG